MGRQLKMWWLALALVLLLAPLAAADGRTGNITPDDVAEARLAVQRVSVPVRGLRDEAAMVLVGTALIALAAAVRRAA